MFSPTSDPKMPWHHHFGDGPAVGVAEHAAFSEMLGKLLAEIEREHGEFVVSDIHSNNHRRQAHG